MDTRRQEMSAEFAAIQRFIDERRKDRAHAHLAELIETRPPLGEQWRFAVRLAQTLGDDEAALEAVDPWIAARPEDPGRRELRLEILERLARTDLALEEATELQQLAGGEAPGLLHQGICLARKARADDSLNALKRVLELEPKRTEAWDYITAQKKFAPGDRDLARLQKAYKKFQSGDPNVLAPVIHAIGKAYDDIGHESGAFKKFTELGRLMRRHSPYDVGGPVKYCGRLVETFTGDLLEGSGVPACEDDSPVFIIGPPRSGTTLLERMLSTHPEVFAGGEHTLLRLATYPLGNLEAFELRRAVEGNASVFADCGDTYVKRVQRRFGEHSRVTDKTPMNHFFVGVMRLALPSARIIWARRDLRDTAWSCFRTRIQGNRWAETLDDTVAYLKAYERLMSHWREVLGERLLVVDYERLVESPGEVMAGVHEHVGLEPDDGWREFHKSPGNVATASLSQVREPLNTRSVGSWRRYAKFLNRPFAAFDE